MEENLCISLHLANFGWYDLSAKQNLLSFICFHEHRNFHIHTLMFTKGDNKSKKKKKLQSNEYKKKKRDKKKSQHINELCSNSSVSAAHNYMSVNNTFTLFSDQVVRHAYKHIVIQLVGFNFLFIIFPYKNLMIFLCCCVVVVPA